MIFEKFGGRTEEVLLQTTDNDNLPERCLFVILVVIVNLFRLLIAWQIVLGCNWLIVLSGRFPGCDWLPVGCYGGKTRSASSSNRRTVLQMKMRHLILWFPLTTSSATTSRCLCIKIIDCNVKILGYPLRTKLLLHLFTRCKRNLVYVLSLVHT